MNRDQLIQQGGRVRVETDEGHIFLLPLRELVGENTAAPDPEGVNIDFALIQKIFDGQDPATQGEGWIDSFRAWGIRTLADGNDDQGVKRSIPGVTHIFGSDGLTLNAAPFEGGFVAGMASAEDLFSFGPNTRIEIEFRLNQISKGQHFAAWLLSTESEWPPEIDLLEFVNSPADIYFNSHHLDGSQGGELISRPFGSVGEFHKLRLDWTLSRLIWSLDGKIVRDVPAVGMIFAMYPLFSWEIGQDGEKSWPQGPDDTTVWPASITLRSMKITRLSNPGA